MFERVETVTHPVSLQERTISKTTHYPYELDFTVLLDGSPNVKEWHCDNEGHITYALISYPWHHDHTQIVNVTYTRVS